MSAAGGTQFEKAVESLGVKAESAVDTYRRLVKRKAAEVEADMAAFLLEAVREKNSKLVREVADAIDFLKNHQEPADKLRSNLLTLKAIHDEMGKTYPIKAIAEMVDWPNTKSDDGFSSLRRLCRELAVPIAPSRKTKRK